MDKREGETSGLRSLSVSDSIDRRELFGGLDRNLEIIEKNLKVDIIQRGNESLLKGENSQKAENLLKEMMGVLEKGGKLDRPGKSTTLQISAMKEYPINRKM